MITATHAYDLVQCIHRVALDLHGDPALRDEPNAFVELLWEGGNVHEEHIVSQLGITADLSQMLPDEREKATQAAIARKEPLIYQGRLAVGDRIGDPDLLEWHAGGYRAGDIKSGSGIDGDEEIGKLKKHYAVQVAHYTSMLDEMGVSDGTEEAFIIDGDGRRIAYALNAPQGPRNSASFMDAYSTVISDLRGIAAGTKATLPALGAGCKLCHWHSFCRDAVVEADDLSMIAELGRSKRDAMIRVIPTVKALAAADLDYFMAGKKTIFPGIGPKSLQKFQERAILLSTPGAVPYLTEPVSLPVAAKEVFFDIETDPLRDGFVYLHGFVERAHAQPDTARFLPYITPEISPEAEEEAFRQAWTYLNERLADSIIYYYSPFEKVSYTALAQRFPSVCSVAKVAAFFANPAVIDLYTQVVRPSTEWPVFDKSIKTIAVYLGFKWRDEQPSGANSIEWFNQWVTTRESAVLQRIKIYNEDDCLATGVVVDGVRQLKLKEG